MQGDELVLLQAQGDVEALDRHLTAQQLVLGPPDRAHAAPAYLLGEPVPSGDQPTDLRHCTLHRAPPVARRVFERHPNRTGLRGDLREGPGSPPLPHTRSA
ncbi:hypothetical protein GCM10010315_02600 [Streptomyces luteosporeus]|uniref:Uncharacterized protein n=1 Tax=Streptomyces luteosporeus TaxID=173856 RepID=A0ABN3TIC5_9ACTN